MDASGPVNLADLEADLALSDDDERVLGEDWRGKPPSAGKRPVTEVASDSSPPAAKTSRRQESSGPRLHPQAPGCSSRPSAPPMDSSPLDIPPLPAFAPRSEYVKLMFTSNPSVSVKLRWLAEVSRAFRLDRDRAEVKMAAVTSRFVFVSRRRSDIVDSVSKGEVLSLPLEVQDSPARPRKFPTYLLTRYPVCADPALAKELPGIYTVRRFHQNGAPINRLVVTWSLPQPPPSSVAFSFLPCLPPCEFRRMKDERPWCYRCWDFGHISRYCTASERCAYCSEAHDSRQCPHRPPPPPDADQMQDDTAGPDTSLWKCPRCHKPGVNVWHPGCPRRRPAPVSAPSRPSPRAQEWPLLPPPPPDGSSSSSATHVTALNDAVAALKTRVASLAERFGTIEARLDSLISKQSTFEATLQSLAESQTVIVTSISDLTEKLHSIASSLARLPVSSVEPPNPAPAPTPSTSSFGSRPQRRSVR